MMVIDGFGVEAYLFYICIIIYAYICTCRRNYFTLGASVIHYKLLPLVLQTEESGYECLVHLTSPSVRVPATRLDHNTVTCDTFQVTSASFTPVQPSTASPTDLSYSNSPIAVMCFYWPILCNCNCNWGTCIAPPARRPRAHHRVNPYLVPVDRMEQKCFQITTKRVRRSQQFQLRR